MRLNKMLVPALLAGLLAACASMSDPGSQSLEERVDAYYAALIERDYRQAYEFFTPAHRKRFSFESHYRTFPPVARFQKARINKKACASEEACRVEVLTTFEFQSDLQGLDGVTTTTTLPNRWVRLDGTWWLLPPH